jgi:hypothetical protein
MKTGPDALSTAENECGDAKHENMTRRPPHRRKRVLERKHENWTRRRRYRQKRVLVSNRENSIKK